MPAGNWYVYDETNSNGVYTKVWVGQQGLTNNAQLGPYATEAAAKAAAEGEFGTTALTGWTGSVATLGAAVGAAAGAIASGNPEAPSASGAAAGANAGAALGNWFQNFSWVQAGQVLLGLILIGVGVARLTHAQNIISTAVKAAAV
jgi:hypothetical protein